MARPDWVTEGAFKRLCDELENGEVVVWAGTGLSVPSGYPTWAEWLGKTAALLRTQENDTLVADLMERHLGTGDLIRAADALFDHWMVGDGLKWALLEQSLPKAPKPSQLHRLLMGLPVGQFVTTNYDAMIEDAYAAFLDKNLRSFTNSDEQIKAAERWGAPGICHIHGVWKEWETIVFASRHYARIKASEAYQQFMRTTIGTRPVLFLGYGGTDPDINDHLLWVAEHVGKRRARFWVGGEPSPVTRDLLRRADVEIIAYPASQHHHLMGLLAALPKRDDHRPEATAAGGGSKDELLRFAVFLSGRQWGKTIDNSVDAALTLSVIREADDYADIGTLADRIHTEYRVAPSTAKEIARRGFDVLVRTGRTPSEQAKDITRSSSEASPAVRVMTKVAEMACGRATVSPPISALAQEILASLLMADGLALSFQLAGGAPRRPPTMDSIRASAVDLVRRANGPDGLADALISGLFLVLKSEDTDVRADLVRLARAAFLLNARFIGGDLVHKAQDQVLRPLYLDANVMLPLIVEGFPTSQSLRSLMDLAKGIGVELRFLRGFANEIRSHRDQALAIWRDSLHENIAELKAYLAATAPLGGNVYLRGFGTANQGAESFDDYLESTGLSFATDDQIIEKLVASGYTLTDCRDVRQRRGRRIAQIQEAIITGKKSEGRFRAASVCEHEAVQLALVEMDNLNGPPTLFLTQDRTLYRIACRIDGGELAAFIQDPRVLGYLLAYENRAIDASIAPLLFAAIEADSRTLVMSLATEKIVERIIMELDEFETLVVPEVYDRLVDAIERTPPTARGEDEVQVKVAEGKTILRKVDEVLGAMLRAAGERKQQYMDSAGPKSGHRK